jgi:hypothetical protein
VNRHMMLKEDSICNLARRIKYYVTAISVNCRRLVYPAIYNFMRAFQSSDRALFSYGKIKKLHGLSPRANYTDRATAAGRRSDCKLFADRGCHVVSVTDPYGRIIIS